MHTKKRLGAATPKALKENNSHNSSSANRPEIQALRTRFLARRHRLTPALAATIAGLVFEGGRAR